MYTHSFSRWRTILLCGISLTLSQLGLAQHDPSSMAIGNLAPVSTQEGGKPFFDIPVLDSQDGKLSVELSVELRKYLFEGDTVLLRTYVHPDLGDLGPCSPTVRVKAGDQVRYTIHNNLPFEGHHSLNYLLIVPEILRKELKEGRASSYLKGSLIKIAKQKKLKCFLNQEAQLTDPVWISKEKEDWRLNWQLAANGCTYTLQISDTLNIANHRQVLKLYEVTHHNGDHNVPHGFNTTNLHVHGWHISPYQDDIFRRVKPSFASEYQYNLEQDHTPGTFWYHPHVHGSTALQVASGMSGALIIQDGNLEAYPDLAEASLPEHEHIMIFNQIMYDPETGELPDFFNLDRLRGEGPPNGTTINGIVQPVLKMNPGEVQRWRLIHSGFNTTLAMHIPPEFRAYQIAVDGIMFRKPRRIYSLHMAPGNRMDIVIKAPTEKVSKKPYDFRVINYQAQCEYFPEEQICREAPADTSQALLQVRVKGSEIKMKIPPNLPGPGPGLGDIDTAEVCKTRHTNLSINNGKFGVNGEVFAANRIDEKPLLGTAEAWKISTDNGFGHPYHIHVNPFQVVAFAGRPVSPPIWKDVVLVTGQLIEYDRKTKLSEAGWALTRTRYQRYWGDFVLHCHILHHEDRGMMQRVRVVRTPEESDLTESEKARANP